MNPSARIVLGYHGCTEEFAQALLLGTTPISAWQPRTNRWDWLGHGVYFWEHSPERAFRWAQEKHGPRGTKPAVLGAVIQLGRCFDLLNEAITGILAQTFPDLAAAYAARGQPLPKNRGTSGKQRRPPRSRKFALLPPPRTRPATTAPDGVDPVNGH